MSLLPLYGHRVEQCVKSPQNLIEAGMIQGADSIVEHRAVHRGDLRDIDDAFSRQTRRAHPPDPVHPPALVHTQVSVLRLQLPCPTV